MTSTFLKSIPLACPADRREQPQKKSRDLSFMDRRMFIALTFKPIHP